MDLYQYEKLVAVALGVNVCTVVVYLSERMHIAVTQCKQC